MGNLYEVFAKIYYEKIGYDRHKKVPIFILFLLLFLTYAVMLIQAFWVNVLFYLIYAYFSMVFIGVLLILVSHLDSWKTTDDAKIEAINYSFSVLFTNFSPDDYEGVLVYINIIEESYKYCFMYRATKAIASIMWFGTTLIFGVLGAYAWYLAGETDSLSIKTFLLLVIMQFIILIFSQNGLYEPVNDRCLAYLTGGYKSYIIENMVSDCGLLTKQDEKHL